LDREAPHETKAGGLKNWGHEIIKLAAVPAREKNTDIELIDF
jgi:hypothetical protein